MDALFSISPLGGRLADGSEGDSPVTVELFDPYREFLENDPDEFMPSDAVWDASLQLTCAMTFLNEQADLPVSLEGLPADEAQAHHFLRNYLMMAGMYRTPAVFQLEKLSFKGATLGAAKPTACCPTSITSWSPPRRTISPAACAN